MHIVIDCRFQTCSGIGRYIREIVSRLVQDDAVKFSLIIDDTAVDEEFMAKCRRPNVSTIVCRAKMYSLREQIEIPLKVPSCDIFWATHYNAPILPLRAKRKIVTIYDMAHLALADMLHFGRMKRCYANLLMYIATHCYDDIFTISNFTKSEILKFEKINPDKIKVHYLGVDYEKYHPVTNEKLLQEVRLKYQLPTEYFLFVGNVKPHKNLYRLVEAYALLLEQRPTDCKLVIAGKKEGFFTGETSLESLIQSRHLEDKVLFTGYVEEHHMPALYTMAKAFVFPSIYEGFGLPPLEAMACGCPVFAANAASMPEVYSEAAVYFNPLDVDDIARVLDQRSGEAFSGNQLKQKYNWHDCASLIQESLCSDLEDSESVFCNG